MVDENDFYFLFMLSKFKLGTNFFLVEKLGTNLMIYDPGLCQFSLANSY